MAEAFVAQNPDCVQPNHPAQTRLKSGSSRPTNSSSVSPHDSIFRIPLRRQLALELLNRTDSNLVESSTPANGTEVVPRQARDIAFRLDSP